MSKNIIILEDDEATVYALRHIFEKHDFIVTVYNCAEDFLMAKKFPEQCIYLIDWNLGKLKGTDVIKTIRIKDKLSTIFMVSGYTEPEYIHSGLRLGADDYISKPFDSEELLIKVVNAYNKSVLISDHSMNKGLKILPEENSIIKEGITVNLTAREFTIFNYLYSNKSLPINREELIRQFKDESSLTDRNIDVHIFSLRKKIEKIGLQVETLRGRGYIINA